METPGCYTETCNFTCPASVATPGGWTKVAVYVSDAGIKDIAKLNRITYQGYEGASQTDILIYHNGQWVGWMSPENKSRRKNLYKSLRMGGVSDWAIDLEDYVQQATATGLDGSTKSVKLGWDPYISGDSRSGN